MGKIQVLGALYAMELNWFARDHFFKIYVCRHYLCGARLAGQIYDDEMAEVMLQHLQILGVFFGPYFGRLVERRRAAELRHDAMDPVGEEFLRAHPSNFLLDIGKIERAVVRKGRSTKAAISTVPSSGSLELDLLGEPSRSFVLTGSQNLPEVAALLSRAVPRTELI